MKKDIGIENQERWVYGVKKEIENRKKNLKKINILERIYF